MKKLLLLLGLIALLIPVETAYCQNGQENNELDICYSALSNCDLTVEKYAKELKKCNKSDSLKSLQILKHKKIHLKRDSLVLNLRDQLTKKENLLIAKNKKIIKKKRQVVKIGLLSFLFGAITTQYITK